MAYEGPKTSSHITRGYFLFPSENMTQLMSRWFLLLMHKVNL